MANHGGGTILLGLSERTDGTFEVAEPRPATLEAYSQDSIARIVSSYAEPPFQVQVIHAERRESNSIHPVVIVPGGHRVPIQAKKGSPDQKTLVVGHVYIRRPTPESAEPATAMEWRDLLDRCVRAGKDDLLDAMRSILDGRSSALETTPETALQSLIRFRDDGLVRWRKSQTDTDPAAPQPLGYYCASYSILGDFTPPGFNELRGFIDRATVRHSGWSPFWVPTRNEISPYVRDEAIECNLDEGGREYLTDPAHQDFWRVSPEGKAMLVRGFDEDSHPGKLVPGKKFDVTLPVWRIGETLLQAEALAKILCDGPASLVFNVRWVGLQGRELTNVENRRYIRSAQIAKEDTFERSVTLDVSTISDQLPEILYEFLRPLYSLFSFNELSKALVDEETTRLRSSRF